LRHGGRWPGAPCDWATTTGTPLRPRLLLPPATMPRQHQVGFLSPRDLPGVRLREAPNRGNAIQEHTHRFRRVTLGPHDHPRRLPRGTTTSTSPQDPSVARGGPRTSNRGCSSEQVVSNLALQYESSSLTPSCDTGHQCAGRVRLLRWPAITEIDSPHLRSRRRLNRRVNLILSQNPSTDGNAWEFTGNRRGNTVGIWELDRVPLRPMAFGSGRRAPGLRHRDIIGHSRSPVAPGAPGAPGAHATEHMSGLLAGRASRPE
jgi:hypothetical protein